MESADCKCDWFAVINVPMHGSTGGKSDAHKSYMYYCVDIWDIQWNVNTRGTNKSRSHRATHLRAFSQRQRLSTEQENQNNGVWKLLGKFLIYSDCLCVQMDIFTCPISNLWPNAWQEYKCSQPNLNCELMELSKLRQITVAFRALSLRPYTK